MLAILFATILTIVSIQPLAGQNGGAGFSPAQAKIARAEKAIQESPGRSEPYNDLALALARRAREIADPNYYAKAEEALRKSFDLAPDNVEGRKVQAWILLGKHEFAQAAELARELNRKMPDDLLIYGFLADANIELGNYKEAEEAAQWMLDMRPGNVPGLTRGAYLRELFGDIEGAIEFMASAYQRTPLAEKEDRAWILTHIAHLELTRGRPDAAEQVLVAAFELFPDYHYALAQMARVRTAQQKHAEAAELLRKLVQAAPYPENIYPLAEALERAGQKEEADKMFAEFEQRALREVDWADNANRELIFYHADHAHDVSAALRIAEKEFARRRDVYTLDAYAWALYGNGEYAEARRQIETALQVGVRDPKLLYHAGAIALKLEDWASARSHFQQSLDASRVSEVSQSAREALRTLQETSAKVLPE